MRVSRIFTYALFVITFITLWLVWPSETKREDFSEVVKIALRDVGNKLLLTKQDSTSLILPVKEISSNSYQVAFNSELSFNPESLVEITEQSIQQAKLPDSYRVEVIQCNDLEVAYSFQRNQIEEETIIPCLDRELPLNCYLITVKFTELSESRFDRSWFLYAFIFATLIFIIDLIRNLKPNSIEGNDISSEKYPIGMFNFYPEQNKLVKAAEEISLSKKECELLEIFVENKNQIIKRDELTKRVWEDNGVIVGRSLDTYISKLRKKLKDDETIRLTNIHGIGYKLEVD
ncbi:MAG: winged helix-turn-helix transcriptional regulator [Psychroserpens sp.]|nr:winged helix-turn-helix transcriptional regulator [Psychroserpens sp.]